MSFLNVLSSGDVLVAVMVFGFVSITEPFVESWLHRVFEANVAFQWAWDNFFAPLLRAVLLVIFVYLAYPSLFGLTVAPTLGTLIRADEVQISSVVGLLFLLGFLLPLVPWFGTRRELILPVQGCLATAYVFYWLTRYLGVTTAMLWPGLDILITMILASFLAHRLARRVGKTIGNWLDDTLSTRGYDLIAVHALELLGQIPVVLLYGFGLGLQLAI